MMPAMPRPPFEASFTSACGTCDRWIEPGDQIRYSDVDHGYVHVRCPWTNTELAANETVCPSCWLVHAGECP